MHLKTRNIDTAFWKLVRLFQGGRVVSKHQHRHLNVGCNVVERPSRNGPVLMIDEPMTLTLTHPKERVLFNQARDANPFLHLFHALWQLAGRNDVAPLAYFAKRMTEFSDDGKTFNAAYGHRWRTWGSVTAMLRMTDGQVEFPEVEELKHRLFGDPINQLDLIVDHLKSKPDSRRAILQIWQVGGDLTKINFSKDVACNQQVMFSIRNIVSDGANPPHPDWKVTESFLDMTVTNRSNDLIWGLLGTDVVDFSFLQEYMAARLECEVGTYHHFTNNLHVYTDGNSGFHPEKWLTNDQPFGFHQANGDDWGAQYRSWTTVPLVTHPTLFDLELKRFMNSYCSPAYRDGGNFAVSGEPSNETFLDTVAEPMFMAYRAYKASRVANAMNIIKACVKDDSWKTAAIMWLERRTKK